MIKFVKPFLATKLAVAGFFLSGIVSQPYRFVVISGRSMAPTYSNRSVHFLKHVDEPPYRGEVVVLNSPVGTIVKRIAYLPGDSIPQIRVGNDWEDLTSVTLSHKLSKLTKIRHYVLKPGQIYVLGDNRMVSVDSRSFGPLPIGSIEGALVDQRSRQVDPDYQPSSRS